MEPDSMKRYRISCRIEVTVITVVVLVTKGCLPERIPPMAAAAAAAAPAAAAVTFGKG